MIDDDDDDEDPRRLKPAHVLREIGIAHLGFRVGKPFSAWKVDVRNDFGEAHERLLYRTLSWLITNGLARRSNERVDWDNRSSRTEERAYLYFRTTDHIPEIPVVESVVTCSICHAPGVTRRSHRDDGTHPTPEERAELKERRWRQQAADRKQRLADAVALWRKQAAEAMETRRARRSSKPARHRRRASRAA